jgi:very-short-patch-repair endonuclease
MDLQRPFRGSEAIANGLVRKHQLRDRYVAVHPDVYVPAEAQLGLSERAAAAWLWSRRKGVVMGLTASAIHGSKWVDDRAPVELAWANARPPGGGGTADLVLHPEEQTVVSGLPVTSAARTGFDVGRRGHSGQAVAALDALMRATGTTAADIAAVAQRHPGVRGLRQLESVLELADAGAQSPKETWLRLLLVKAGLPRPRTQVPVYVDELTTYYLDLGWEDVMVAVEYDGEQHRVDRWQYTKDIRRSEDLTRLGWIILRVVAGDRAPDVVRRVSDALRRRTSTLR